MGRGRQDGNYLVDYGLGESLTHIVHVLIGLVGEEVGKCEMECGPLCEHRFLDGRSWYVGLQERASARATDTVSNLLVGERSRRAIRRIEKENCVLDLWARHRRAGVVSEERPRRQHLGPALATESGLARVAVVRAASMTAASPLGCGM